MSKSVMNIMIDGELYLLVIKRHSIHADAIPEQQQCLTCGSWETFKLYLEVQQSMFEFVPAINIALFICTDCHAASEIKTEV